MAEPVSPLRIVVRPAQGEEFSASLPQEFVTAGALRRAVEEAKHHHAVEGSVVEAHYSDEVETHTCRVSGDPATGFPGKWRVSRAPLRGALRTASGPVCLLVGSRELGWSAESIWWTLTQLTGWLAEDERPSRAMVVEGHGASSVFRRFLPCAQVPFDVWYLNGNVEGQAGRRRWHEGQPPEDRRWPLHRFTRMIASCEDAVRAGERVRVLVLTAPWDAGGGDRWAAETARRAGLDVTELECPAAYGPAVTAAPAATTTTRASTEGTTAP